MGRALGAVAPSDARGWAVLVRTAVESICLDEPGHNLPAESGHRSHDDRTPPLVRSLYKDGQGQRIKEGKGGYRMDQAVKEIAAEEAKEIATEVKEEIAPLGAAEVISLALTAGFVMTILSILLLMLGIV
jgi:hypothetical protein